MLKKKAGEDDGKRHLAGTLHLRRKHIAALQIVKLKECKNNCGSPGETMKRIRSPHNGGVDIKGQHQQEYRRLHEEPAPVAADGDAPPVVEGEPIGRSNKL